MVNSRKKGNTAEREVCKILSHYFHGNFERRSLGIKGADIIASDNGFPYATEVKHHKAVKAIHTYVGHSLLRSWWNQTQEQAVRINKKPLLVAKIDRCWLCTEDYNDWQVFLIWCEFKRTKHEQC